MLQFDPQKLLNLRGHRPRSELRDLMQADGETVAGKSIWEWEKGNREPRARSLLAIARVIGPPKVKAAADTLLNAFFTDLEPAAAPNGSETEPRPTRPD